VRRRHGEPGSEAPTKELSCPQDTRAPLEMRTQRRSANKHMKHGFTSMRRPFRQSPQSNVTAPLRTRSLASLL
jgi:hypothetical protein